MLVEPPLPLVPAVLDLPPPPLLEVPPLVEVPPWLVVPAVLLLSSSSSLLHAAGIRATSKPKLARPKNLLFLFIGESSPQVTRPVLQATGAPMAGPPLSAVLRCFAV